MKAAYKKIQGVKLDIKRNVRCGFEEAIYAPGKTQAQLEKLTSFFLSNKKTLIITRLEKQAFDLLKNKFPALEFNPVSKTAYFVPKKAGPSSEAYVLVVTAGSADTACAEEACVVLRALGVNFCRLYDAGVAGIERLLSHKKLIRNAACVITVAGMDAAISSVISGLVRSPVVAVPTSCGYGANFKGISPLLSMLNTCAAGIGVVNIDNGFGAAVLAAKIIGINSGKDVKKRKLKRSS